MNLPLCVDLLCFSRQLHYYTWFNIIQLIFFRFFINVCWMFFEVVTLRDALISKLKHHGANCLRSRPIQVVSTWEQGTTPAIREPSQWESSLFRLLYQRGSASEHVISTGRRRLKPAVCSSLKLYQMFKCPRLFLTSRRARIHPWAQGCP